MPATIIAQSTTFWSTREGAELVANRLQRDDPDWQYRVEPAKSRPGWWIIAVRDESGWELGCL